MSLRWFECSSSNFLRTCAIHPISMTPRSKCALYPEKSSQHADLRVLVQALPRQSHDERLQLIAREFHACAKMRTRSDKVPLLQTSCAQPQTKAIVDEHLNAIGSAVHEEVCMMRASLAEHTHHSSKRRVHPRAHVQRFNSQPSRIDADHLMSSRSSNAHSRAADAGHSTLTVLEPRRTSIRIAVSLEVEEMLTGIKPPAFSIGALGAADRLGTSFLARPAAPSGVAGSRSGRGREPPPR